MVGHRVQPETRTRPPAGRRYPQRLHRRRLAGAVRPQDDEHLAGGGGQVESVDRGGCPGSVAHSEAGDLDGWHGVADYFEQE